MARYDDLETGSIAYATFLSCILLIIIILLVRALCYSWLEGEDDRKLADAHYVTADAEISEQKSNLSGYKKVMVEVMPPPAEDGQPSAAADEPKLEERIRIPIDRAKELLLEELSKTKSPQPST